MTEEEAKEIRERLRDSRILHFGDANRLLSDRDALRKRVEELEAGLTQADAGLRCAIGTFSGLGAPEGARVLFIKGAQAAASRLLGKKPLKEDAR